MAGPIVNPSRTGDVHMTWNGDAIASAIHRGVWTGLVRAGVILEASMKEVVGVPGHPIARRSLPGEPPRVETNLLRKSITTNPSEPERVVRVGTNQPHGRYMEYGTRNVLPRPWVARSIARASTPMRLAMQNAVRQAIAGAVKK